MSLRGLHVKVLDDDARGVLARTRPALVKTMDHGRDWKRAKAQYDIEFLLGRVHLDDVADLAPTPEGAAEKLWALMAPKIAPHVGVYDAIETPWNERFVKGGELIGHALATRRFCELAHDAGFRVAVGNFNVGTPEPWDLAEVFGIALESADYLSVHEYWLPGNFLWRYWCGRWKRLLDALPEDLRLPVIITECGIDGGLEETPRERPDAGWRAYGMSGDHYAALLDEYWRSLDERCLGMCVFNCGDDPEHTWRAFEVAGAAEVEQWLAEGPRLADEPRPPGDEGPPSVEEQPVTQRVTECEPDFNALRPWPWRWNQLADATIDGRPDENADLNCGPQSLAECVYYLTCERVEFKADEIHDQVMPEGKRDVTYAEQLALWCGWHGIFAEVLTGDARTRLEPKVRWAIDNGKPIVVLFFFDLEKLTGGHWCPVYAYNTVGCWRANPLGGKSEFMTWAEFERAHLFGQALILHKTRPGWGL